VVLLVVVYSIHMLISSWLSPEPLIAGLALELRLPVVKCIHVLDSSQLVNKLAIACLALIVAVHLELVFKWWPIKFRSNNKW
jgi:hypothetical protein